jgi:hypothetical protein
VRVIVLLLASGCVLREPVQNGIDHQLTFRVKYDDAAVGATNHVTVVRNDGDRLCVEGKSGEDCDAQSTKPIVLDSADCGDGCTATITGAQTIDVAFASEGAFEVAVTAHAGKDTWHDRYPLHATRPLSFAIVSADAQPIGAAYATEVGARTALIVCAVAGNGYSSDLMCLGGDFDQAITGDGVVAAMPTIAIPDDDPISPTHQPFGVVLATPGTGNLHVTALGLSRTIAFRAAAPADWQRIEFAPYDTAVAELRDIALGGFVGAPLTDVTIDHTSFDMHYIVATAVLADGSRALLSAPRLACLPATRASATPQNFSYREMWSQGTWASLVEIADYGNLSPGDATCAVTGYEALGTLSVHVK